MPSPAAAARLIPPIVDETLGIQVWGDALAEISPTAETSQQTSNGTIQLSMSIAEQARSPQIRTTWATNIGQLEANSPAPWGT